VRPAEAVKWFPVKAKKGKNETFGDYSASRSVHGGSGIIKVCQHSQLMISSNGIHLVVGKNFISLDEEPMNKQRKEVMSASLSETQKIAVAILDLLAEKKTPCAPDEVVESLAKKHDPWQVREVIWNLTAKAATELTWDRKLKLGPHKNHYFALAA
jgi:hypothetical protein